MSAEPTTRLIERERLSALLESSRSDTPPAHTVRREDIRRGARARPPSAVRGLAIVVGAALILRALMGWLF